MYLADRHSAGGLFERHFEKYRKVPDVDQFHPVQEQSVHDDDRPGRGGFYIRCQRFVAVQVMPRAPVPTGAARTEQFENELTQSGVIEGVQPETIGR